MSTTTNTEHDQNVANKATGEAEKVDYPITDTAVLLHLCEIGLNTKQFIRHKAIKEPSYAVFLMIMQTWISEKRGLTIYEICKRLNSHHPAREWDNTVQKIALLFGKRMIEIIGKGNGRANIYAPVSEAMRELVEFTTAA